MKHKFLLSAIFLLASQHSFSQFHYRKDWDHRYGGLADDKLETFHETSDKGFILGGTSYSDLSFDKTENSRGQSDYWIVKTDSLGVMQWNKTFGGSNYDDLREVKQTSDGGYILGGSSRSGISGDKSEPNWDMTPNSPTHDYWIVKTDANGNKQWDKRFGGIYSDVFTAIQQTSDNGYILGGYSEGNASGDRTENSRGGPDYWIVKTDASGNKQWDKRFGGNRNDQLWALQQTNDGGYILGGFSWSDSSGDKSVSNYGLVSYSDFWIIKIDAQGNKQWDNHYGGINNEYLYSIQQTSDNGYILGGPSWSDSTADKTSHNFGPPNTSDYWIVKTNSLGTLMWEKSFGGVNHEDEYGTTVQTSDDGYLISGTSYSDISGNKTERNLGIEQSWMIKTNFAGTTEWDKTIFTSGHDERGLALQASDGSYVIANYTNSTIGGYKTEDNRDNTNISYDYWLIKFKDSLQVHPIANFFTPSRDVCPKTCIDYMNMSLNANSYSWIFQGGVPSHSNQINPTDICYNAPGVYDVTLIASDGVESDTMYMPAYIQVFPPPVPLTIVHRNDTLFSPDVFSTYQWFRNNQPIAGANDFFLVITMDGLYDVNVTDSNGCSANNEINVVTSGIQFIPDEYNIDVYPNPSRNLLNLTFTIEGTENVKVSLINAVGQEVSTNIIEAFTGANFFTMSVQPYPEGIYYLTFKTSEMTVKRPVVIIH